MISRRSFVSSLGYLGATAALRSHPMPVAHERPLTDITTSSARRLAAAIRRREVSSVEVVEAFLRRIEEINPKPNAVVQLDRQGGLTAARAANDRIRRRDRLGPLHGVPMTVKDSFDTAGMISTAGTLGRKAFFPARDAIAVARLRNAGAIVFGKTNCSELTLSYETDNLVYGRTNNPYDLHCTSGGSSGGAAAILAASGSPLDLGSDTGGSIRVPSHFCGTAGLKPTSGRVPRTGHCAFPAPQHGATLKEDLDTAFSYSEVYNYVGWPAVVVRGGTSDEGLPIGVQIVARPWREDVALAIAYRLEKELGGWRPPVIPA